MSLHKYCKTQYLCKIEIWGTSYDHFWGPIRPQLGQKWTESGPDVGQKWTGSGPEVDQKWAGSGPEKGQKWNEIITQSNL